MGIAWLVIVAAEMLVGGTASVICLERVEQLWPTSYSPFLVIGVVGNGARCRHRAAAEAGHLRRLAMAFLEVQGLSKIYPAKDGRPVPVFEGVGFAIEQGEFVCIVGHFRLRQDYDTQYPRGAWIRERGRGDHGPAGGRGPEPRSRRGVPGARAPALLSVLKNIAFAVRSRWPKWDRIQLRAALPEIHRHGRLTGASTRSRRSSPAA